MERSASLLGTSCAWSILSCDGCLSSMCGGRLVESIFFFKTGVWDSMLVLKLKNKSLRNAVGRLFTKTLCEQSEKEVDSDTAWATSF